MGVSGDYSVFTSTTVLWQGWLLPYRLYREPSLNAFQNNNASIQLVKPCKRKDGSTELKLV